MSEQTKWQRRVNELMGQSVDWLAGRVAAQEELEDKIVALVAGGRIAGLEAENARLREALGEAVAFLTADIDALDALRSISLAAAHAGDDIKVLLNRLRAAL